jgi:hypothetical protein
LPPTRLEVKCSAPALRLWVPVLRLVRKYDALPANCVLSRSSGSSAEKNGA